jgi:hypothetical protein
VNQQIATVYFGQLKTSNFEFIICGDSEAQVQQLAKDAWEKHRKDTGARWTWEDVEDSLYILKMITGQVQKN